MKSRYLLSKKSGLLNFLKTSSSQSLQYNWRMLQLFFDVTLQKCFVYYDTSPGFQLTWEWVDNDWM